MRYCLMDELMHITMIKSHTKNDHRFNDYGGYYRLQRSDAFVSDISGGSHYCMVLDFLITENDT